MAHPIRLAPVGPPPVVTPSMAWRFAVPALSSGLLGLWLAWHYPVLPWAMSALFIGACILFWAYPAAGWVIAPALLPVIGWAPWTGWISFEEFDLLLLAVAAGGYACMTLSRRSPASDGPARLERGRGAGGLARLITTFFAASVLVAMARGFIDAGGFEFGWYQGYREPMNSLRLAKPFMLALLLWPLWRAACADAAESSCARLSLGLMLGLVGVALAAVWERLAYTGLLDFSSDYRTTALFWEMQVGGAAIDGSLALTLPFAVREMLAARSRLRWAAAAVATLLAGYACLSTFSRALYLAAPMGLGVLVYVQTAQRRRLVATQADRAAGSTTWPGLLLVACFAATAAWMFPTSGYRGVLALLGAFAALLALANPVRRFGLAQWLLGLGLGLMVSGLAVACAWVVPKGAYVAFALAALFTLAMLAALRLRRGRARHGVGDEVLAPLALAGFVAVLAGMVLVGRHWGGGPGLDRTLPSSAILLAALMVVSRRKSSAWPVSLRWQGTALGAMVMVAGIVGVFAGGSYMTDRFAGDSTSLGGRLQNWRLGIAMLDTPLDWAVGKGLGRFPANYALATVGTDMRPGDYRLASDARGQHLVLSAGTHPLGWLELLRFSQRVSTPQPPVSVRFDVRAPKPVSLVFEVCEKQLLYSEACLAKTIVIEPESGRWQTRQLVLDGSPPSRGAWYAPKLIVFSVAVGTEGGRAELDDLVLTGADGANLLVNGGFGDGLSHWFFTSDGYHTPWHIEGMLMNALFDQGIVGVVLLTALLAGALWRLTLGSARDHGLAPPLAAALVGFVVVGLFSSVTDVPRVAFLFYFMLLLGLGLRGRAAALSGPFTRPQQRDSPP